MKKFIIRFGIVILKIIYFPMKLLKTKNKIVYISRQFNNETLDFELLRKQIEEIEPDLENIVLTKRMEKGIRSSLGYMVHMLRQMYHIATSKVVIVDTYCIVVSVLTHKKDTKIIQLWHAMGAIKKFGYQTIGKKSGTTLEMANTMCMHKNYDYIICSSPITKTIFLEAFNCKEEQIKYIAMPRTDYILKEKDVVDILNTYPELREKQNILYVPTFRKGKKIKINQIINNINTDKYNLIIKLHPLDKKSYKYIKKDGIIYDDKFKSYDLLQVCDKIVTDYSSLAIEASLLDKPIYFYTYDIDEYKDDPGLNLNFEQEEIGKYQTSNPHKLIKLIEEEYDYNILNDFKKRYINVDTHNCTNKLAKFILELINDKRGIKEIYNTNIKEEHTV